MILTEIFNIFIFSWAVFPVLVQVAWTAPNPKLSIFGEKPPCICLGTFAWENIHAYFASPLTGEKAGDFKPLLLQLR